MTHTSANEKITISIKTHKIQIKLNNHGLHAGTFKETLLQFGIEVVLSQCSAYAKKYHEVLEMSIVGIENTCPSPECKSSYSPTHNQLGEDLGTMDPVK